MIAKTLLEDFAHLGDEPENIRQIKKLVIILAISGKLTQSDDDFDPSQLLEMILHKICDAARSRRGDARLAKSVEDLLNLTAPSDAFVPLGTIAQIAKGRTGIMQAKPGTYPLVVTADDRLTCDHFDFDGAAAIIPLVSSTGHGKASLNRLHYQDGKFALGNILAAAFPFAPDLTSPRFLFEYLSAFKDELLVSQMSGTANVTLTLGRIANVPVPLIPPATQNIVDRLMELLDDLRLARAQREEDRERFISASVSRLDDVEADVDVGTSYVVRAIDAFDIPVARIEPLGQFRQSILQLTIRGKLVRQSCEDEPVTLLLQRIEGLPKEANCRKPGRSKNIELIDPPSMPFAIPKSWAWVRLGDIVTSRDGERRPISKAERNQRAKLFDYYGASGIIDRIDGYLFDKPLLLIGEDGANLINRSTPIAFIARGKYWVNNHAHVIDGLCEDLLRYLEIFINAIDLKPYVTGTAQPKLNQARLISIPVALPPLDEQRRIVAKFDELMLLCDELQQVHKAVRDVRRELLSALIDQAFAARDSSEAEYARAG